MKLDETRPANICIPPSFLGNTPVQVHGIPSPKIHLQEKKQNLVKSLFYKKKIEKEFDKLTFVNSQFVEHKIWHFL
jgi:hypothetical protein